jgi:hypothetical protein
MNTIGTDLIAILAAMDISPSVWIWVDGNLEEVTWSVGYQNMQEPVPSTWSLPGVIVSP